MAAHARLKNEFTEDEKYHNLMTWLKFAFIMATYVSNFFFLFESLTRTYRCKYLLDASGMVYVILTFSDEC